MKKTFFLTICSVLFFLLSVDAQQAQPKVIPEFTFLTLKDSVFIRSDLAKKGKIVFMFYDPGCGHCQKETTLIARHFERFKHASFYFVSMQDKPLIETFMEKYGKSLQDKPNVYFIRDSKYEFVNTFYPKEYPSIYVYQAESQRLLAYLSGELTIAEIIDAVNQ